MKNYKITILLVLTLLLGNFATAQTDSWSVGVGASNVIIRGDLINIGKDSGKSEFNYGFNVFVDKMINPIFGVELMGQYFNMSGGSNISNSNLEGYNPLYTKEPLNNVYFKGTSLGGSLSAIINLTNLSNIKKANTRKFFVNTYFGAGLHYYDSKLYRATDNTVLVDFGKSDKKSKNSSSSYFLAGIGFKYNLNSHLGMELRSTYNFNYEDHLDAAISSKQNQEHFIVTMLSLNYRFGSNKNKSSEEETKKEVKKEISLLDTDKDGVIDEYDKDNKTPAGVKVYGDGTAVDTDKDGVPDSLDECPLAAGTANTKGCPISEEKVKSVVVEEKLNYLVKNIYFGINSSLILTSNYPSLAELALILNQNPKLSFYIDGHTDNLGNETFNLKLSKERAVAIKEFLEKNFKVAKNQLEARGFGSSVPVSSNKDFVGRQLNRRVEIKLKQ